MGIYADRRRGEWNGHVIEVAAKIVWQRPEHTLIIDGQKVDSVHGTIGTFRLKGTIPGDGGRGGTPVTVRIERQLADAVCFLEIEGQSYEMEKVPD